MAHKKKPSSLFGSKQKPRQPHKSWLPGYLLAFLFAFLIVGIFFAESFLRSLSPAMNFFHMGGLFLLILSTFILASLYLNKFEPDVTASRTGLSRYAGIAVALVLLGRILMISPWSTYLTPCALIGMIYAVVYNQRFSITTMLLLSLLVSMNFDSTDSEWASFSFDFTLFAGLGAGSVAAIFGVAHIRTRTRLITVGFLSGFVSFVVIFAARLMEVGSGSEASSWFETLRFAGLGFTNCFICGFLMTGLLPFVEKVFDVTTDLSLIELSDLNQPMLREFSLVAPGTYHHSLRVGQLAEAAAEAIGANPLLTRAGSYFHDIGKRSKAEYFTENEMGKGSKHSRLSPALSTLIIMSHTKDGVDIAEELGLPQKLIDIITQHHGTTLVEYFYHEAKEEYGENGERVQEGAFRYPGPRPAFKEAAIILLADAVEASSRSLDDPSPSRIENLVETITNRKLIDNQLDDSELTLTDLKKIRESFVRVLIAMFHSRVRYPSSDSEINPEKRNRNRRSGHQGRRSDDATTGPTGEPKEKQEGKEPENGKEENSNGS